VDYLAHDDDDDDGVFSAKTASVSITRSSAAAEIVHVSDGHAVQGHSRSSLFGTNRKPICDFLLVTNANLYHISHRFQVIAD